jgi:hypothetical protein
MSPDAYRAELREQLAKIERQIESHKAAILELEYERRRLKYVLGEHVRTVPRMDSCDMC